MFRHTRGCGNLILDEILEREDLQRHKLRLRKLKYRQIDENTKSQQQYTINTAKTQQL